MMMKKYILGTLCIASLIFGACEDFLMEVNPNAMSSEVYWKNLEDCNSGLTAVYHTFKDQNIFQFVEDNNRADLTYPGYGRPSTSNVYWLQTFTDASDAPNKKWTALYTGIFRANQVIKALNNIESTCTTEGDKEEWKQQMGQARFFRGLFHYYLHSSFNNGNVLIFDFVPTDEKEFFQPLSSSDEVKAFFREDLEYALNNLKDCWYEIKTDGTLDHPEDAGRVTSIAAATVLGTSYLYDKDYEKACEYFRIVLNNNRYKLADVSENFTTKGELNCESILEVVYTMNYNTEYDTWSDVALHNMLHMSVSPLGGWRTIIPSAWLTMAYKEERIDTKDSRNFVFNGKGEMVGFRKYSLRASNSIALVDDEESTYYGYRPGVSAPFNNKEYAYFKKYSNWDIYENENDASPQQRSGINYRVIRLADVYLMYAECMIKGGTDDTGLSEALKYINRVRRRSAIELLGQSTDLGAEYAREATYNETIYTAQSLMEHLMYIERPLELSIEGHAIRQIDLRRWGITKQRFQYLSQQKFTNADPQGTPYTTIGKDGKEVKRWGARLYRFNSTIHTEAQKIVDYEQAAGNYNEKMHAYYPIPNGETMANPNLYNK